MCNLVQCSHTKQIISARDYSTIYYHYRFKHKQFRGRGTESTDGVSTSVHSRGFDTCVRNIVLSPTRQVNVRYGRNRLAYFDLVLPKGLIDL